MDPVPDKARDQDVSAIPPAASPLALAFAAAEAKTEQPAYLTVRHTTCITCGVVIPGWFYCPDDQPGGAL